jgi:hypothetical protein
MIISVLMSVCIFKQILRLEPHFEVQQPAHSKQSALEAGSSIADTEYNRRELTLAFGTKTDRAKVCLCYLLQYLAVNYIWLFCNFLFYLVTLNFEVCEHIRT